MPVLGAAGGVAVDHGEEDRNMKDNDLTKEVEGDVEEDSWQDSSACSPLPGDPPPLVKSKVSHMKVFFSHLSHRESLTSQSSWLAPTESQLGRLVRRDLLLVQALSPHQQSRLVSMTLQKAKMILCTTSQLTWSQTRRRKKRRSCTSRPCGLPVRSSHLQNRGRLLPVSLSLLPSHQRTSPGKARRPIEQCRIPPPPANAI